MRIGITGVVADGPRVVTSAVQELFTYYMAVRYRIDVEDNTGSTVAIFEDFISLSFTQKISAKGSYQFSISGFDSRVSDIVDDSIVRVWFQDLAFGIDWLNIFVGIHKTFNDSLAQNGQRTFTSYGPALEELLEKTWILYPATSTQAVKSGAASTVMYEYVAENAGPDGDDAARDYPVQNVLSAASDPALGGTWADTKPRKNLLEVIREISDFTRENNSVLASKVDFRVNYLGSYQFQFQAGALGADRTTDGLAVGTLGLNGAGNAPVIFAAELGNILSENRSKSRYNEANVVVALGQGYGEDRRVATATNAASLAASGIAQREAVVNASQSADANLANVADAKLQELVAQERFSFTPRKGASVLYRDYFLADYVTAQDFRTATRVNKQLREIATTVNFSEADVENITMKFEDV